MCRTTESGPGYFLCFEDWIDWIDWIDCTDVCVWQPGLSGHFSFSSFSSIANRLLNQTKTRLTQAIPVGAVLIITLILVTGCVRGDGRTEQAVADVDGKVQVAVAEFRFCDCDVVISDPDRSFAAH